MLDARNNQVSDDATEGQSVEDGQSTPDAPLGRQTPQRLLK